MLSIGIGAFDVPDLRESCRRRSLSQRVSTYNQRIVGEKDALAEEVSMSIGAWLDICIAASCLRRH